MKSSARCAVTRSLIEGAEQAREAGRFDVVVDLATQAVDSAREHDDLVGCGHSLMLLAGTHLRLGRLETAYSAASNAHSMLAQTGNTELRLRALNICAIVRGSIGDNASAIEIWRRATSLATGLEASNIRCIMIDNVAEDMLNHGEHEQAIQCLMQGVMLAERAPQRPGQHTHYASKLARAHVRYADHLAATGCATGAQAQLQHAASVLPTLDPLDWRGLSYHDFNSLQAQVEVLSALGNLAGARRAAAAQLVLTRQTSHDLTVRADALVTLGDLYRRTGQKRRAIHYVHRALLIWRSIQDQYETVRSLSTLAALHADCGNHTQALRLCKNMMAYVGGAQAQRSAMSRRLAVIERAVETQLADAQDRMAHAQRLSIIGRLIGQIHHALQAPIQRTRQLCVLALRAHERSIAEGSQAPGMPALLSAISQSVDEAANLSRQLKIYAYRSSPVTTTLSIDASLREVWATLNPHVSAHPRELRVGGDTSLHVRADPQRLGVLLTLMLIELVKKQASSNEPVMVNASIEAEAPGSVALVMDSNLPNEALDDDTSTVALIETLCKEIAADIGATLSCTHPGGTLRRSTLVMLDADREP